MQAGEIFLLALCGEESPSPKAQKKHKTLGKGLSDLSPLNTGLQQDNNCTAVQQVDYKTLSGRVDRLDDGQIVPNPESNVKTIVAFCTVLGPSDNLHF